MTSMTLDQLLQHEAFKDLAEPHRQRLLDGSSLLTFELGQQVVEPGVVPGRVLIVLKGQARLVGTDQERLISLGKYGPGTVLGAASLLSGRSCEALIASDPLTTVSIPEDLWVELYQQDFSFRTWCDQQLWAQEVIAVVQDLQRGDARAEATSLRHLKKALAAAQPVAATADAIEAAQAQGRQVVMVSAWNGALPGTVLNPGELPPVSEPFPARLISLPAELVQTIRSSTHLVAEPPPSAEGQPDAEQPTSEHSDLSTTALTPISRFDPNSDVLGQLQLISAEGVLQETLACFQMLAQIMKLPVRRDAIEKILRETLRRGQAPNLRLCGQIAAGLGLHVSGARVSSEMGTRLQTPSLIPWAESFALVVRSNQKGLTLASPKEGILELEPEALASTFPEGIDLLLLDRTNTTPNESFGPSWFWPALKRHRRVLIQVLVASFVVQLFALANPLLIQVIIDKVISQRSLDTLQVLGIALIAVTFLEGCWEASKRFCFLKRRIASISDLVLK